MNACMLICFLLINFNKMVSALSTQPKLLIVAFDGLRWDFLTESKMPNLTTIGKLNAWSLYGLRNQMVTVTAPNFYTIATGLYEESHGVVGNLMYDPPNGRFFDYLNFTGNETLRTASHDAFWFTGEPIWLTNQRAAHDRFSGSVAWPLSDTQAGGGNITYCQPFPQYGAFADWTKSFDQLLMWFNETTNPINLGMYYVGYPDHIEHMNDIYSSQVQDYLTQLDNLIGYIQNTVMKHGFADQMDIIYTADHGHINVYYDYNSLDLDEYIDPKTYIWQEKSFFPNNGLSLTELYSKLKKINDQFPKFFLWCKSKIDIPECLHEIPAKYNYKNNARIGPIIVIEYPGFFLYSNTSKIVSKSPKTTPIFGNHGFSPDEPGMWPYFIAAGPSFKKNYTLNVDQQPENVDLYDLMCYLLNVTPQPNNGSWERIRLILRDEGAKWTRTSIGPTPSSTSPTIKRNIVHSTLLAICISYVTTMFILL